MIQKALLSELVLLSELKKSNLDINQANIDQVDQKYKKTFLTTRFNLFLPSYIDGITKTVNSNESPSTSDSTPTVEELQKEDDSSVINSNEAPTIDKTEILKNNLAKFNLKFDFSDDEKNKIIQTIDNIQNNIVNFNAQIKKNIGVVGLMTKVVTERTIGIVGDGLIKDMGKFSNGNPFSTENIKIIFEYINIVKEIIIDANNETIEKYNNKIKKENKEAKRKNTSAIEKLKIEEIKKKDLFPIILKKLNDFSEKIKLYDADAISLNSLKAFLKDIIEYEASKEKDKSAIIKNMITNIAIIFKVIKKNFIVPGVLSFLGESEKKNDNAATVQNLLQTLYPNDTFDGLLADTSNINDSNKNLFEETSSNNEEETQNQQLIQELQEQNIKLQQNLQNEQEKNKTLQEELTELKQQLNKSKQERDKLSSSDNSDSGVENNNLHSLAIPKDDGSNNRFNDINLEDIKLQEYSLNSDTKGDQNNLPNFLEDKRDLKELRGTNQELTDKIIQLTNQLKSNDQKSQEQIVELNAKLNNTENEIKTLVKMNSQNEKNELEKLQKIISKPKATIETQTAQKLSILKQIMQFFSELLESLSKKLTSLGKEISPKLSEFSCFNCKTQNV